MVPSRHFSVKKSDVQRGSAMVLVVSMSVIVSMGVLYVFNRTNTNRSVVKRNLEKTASFYATEAARQHAQSEMSDFVSNRMREAYSANAWASSGSGDKHLLEPGNPINRGVNTNTFFNTLRAHNNWADLKQSNSNSRKHQYKFLYFNDLNGNERQDAGEEDFVLVNAPTNGVEEQNYAYRYNITAIGKSGQREERILLTGELRFGLSKSSFAQYALFTDTHKTASGSDLWFTNGSVFDGPVHTNGNNNSWLYFAANIRGSMDSATFKGKVTSSSTKLSYLHYDNRGRQVVRDETPSLSDLNPVSRDGVTPIFDEGYERGMPEIELPKNSFSQARAALGSDSTNNGNMSNNEVRKALGLSENGRSVPDGVYTPTNGDNAKGGIFIQGDVDEMYTYVQDGKQKIYIRQGSSRRPSAQTTITIDPNTKEMIVEDHLSNTQTTLKNANRNILHVEGKINSMGGPPRQPNNSNDTEDAPPSIQKDTPMTISATGDIVVQRDIKYEADPRGADRTFGTADDDMQSKNMLGLFSSGGDVRIGTSAPNNMSIHASIMAASDRAQFTVDNYASRAAQGDLNVLGGIIQNYYGASGTFNYYGQASGYNPSRTYDRRFARSAPPFFPTTSEPPEISEIVMSEIDWKEMKS